MGQQLSRYSRHDGDPWFRPNLRARLYDEVGDAYSDDIYTGVARDWVLEPDVKKERPYLAFVKQISNRWLHLRLLADFMQIGTHPTRWKKFHTSAQHWEEKRNARLAKMKIRRLDYGDKASPPSIADFNSETQPDAVGRLAQDLTTINDKVQFRLYVVEDLSSDVIEVLGSGLEIEPSFFRAHIVDYVWYNVRDRWRDPPNLDIMSQQQSWIQLRYVTARYFESREDFDMAAQEAENFNVLRRPDNDISNSSWWNSKDAIVGLTRSRATFWLKPEHKAGAPAIGVLLLDPTVEKGNPLWRGRRNWSPTPSPNSPVDTWGDLNILEQRKFFDDFLYWVQKPETFGCAAVSIIHHFPIQVLLHLVCSEWRTISDYIKTRLSHIDLEIWMPNKFAANIDADNVLGKLLTWRRLIPIYREMVLETLDQFSRLPCHTETFSCTNETLQGDLTPITRHCQEGSPQQALAASINATSSLSNRLHHTSSTHGNTQAQLGSVSAYKHDFLLILRSIEEYKERIELLIPVVTAAIQIEDSRRAVDNDPISHNVGRLTWLATFFIPFILIASAFSMQPHVTDISGTTVRYYFASAVPLAVSTVLIARLLSSLWLQRVWYIWIRQW